MLSLLGIAMIIALDQELLGLIGEKPQPGDYDKLFNPEIVTLRDVDNTDTILIMNTH